ncbi:hypothetical protein [Sutcliffiella deserti]|nr:hypothetical protein [Sutcliffiella deserti]
MSKHNKHDGPSQKGKPIANNIKEIESAEEVARAIQPRKRQNSEQ